MLCSGGCSSTRPGATMKRSASGRLSNVSAVSVTKLHSSTPSRSSDSSAANGMPVPARLKRRDPRDQGCAANERPPAARMARR